MSPEEIKLNTEIARAIQCERMLARNMFNGLGCNSHCNVGLVLLQLLGFGFPGKYSISKMSRRRWSSEPYWLDPKSRTI